MTVKTAHRAAAVATALLLASGGVVAAAAPAAAACNSVAQYVLTGRDGTIRDADGATIAYWYRNYVINTWGYGGRQDGLTYGNVYTADRRYVASGDVVSAYMTYSRSFCA